MFKPDKRLQRLYDTYNKKYWDGKLPYAQVGWSEDMKKTDMAGLTLTHTALDVRGDVIAIDDQYKTLSLPCSLKEHSVFAKQTLLHEMVHIALHPYDKHGRRFREEIKRIFDRGAYDGLL